MIIESKDNKHFKEFRKLTSVDGVRKYSRVIVSGKKLIKEISQSAAHSCVALITYEGYANDDAPLLVFQTPEIPEWDFSLADGCNLLIPFQDPQNVGAVIRSAAGFGVNKVIVLKEAAHPFHPRCIKASSGAVLKYSNVPSSNRSVSSSSLGMKRLREGGTSQTGLFSGPSINDLKSICQEISLKIIALDMAGTPISIYNFPERFALLAGLEGQGVPEELKVNSISIPLNSTIESLNAAIATSIALFALNIKQRSF
jgi:tRNA G18 (ribose-2'-O)-methylase SpoU